MEFKIILQGSDEVRSSTLSAVTVELVGVPNYRKPVGLQQNKNEKISACYIVDIIYLPINLFKEL